MSALAGAFFGASLLSAQVVGMEDVVSAIERNYERFWALPGLEMSYDMTYQHWRGHVQFTEPHIEYINAFRRGSLYGKVRTKDGEHEAGWNGTIGTDLVGRSYQITPTAGGGARTRVRYIDALFYPEGRAQEDDPEGINFIPGWTGGPDYWLPDALKRNAAKYRLSSVPEEVDGAKCAVLEWSGRDRLWLDPALNYAIRRRDFRREDRVMRDRVFFREFENVSEGLWLPRLIVREQYCSIGDSRELQGQVSGVRTIQVKEMKVEPLGDERFVVPIPEGARVYDLVRHITYDALKPGDDPIGRAEAQVRRMLRGNRGGYRIWWFALGLGALAVVAVGAVWRLRRMRTC